MKNVISALTLITSMSFSAFAAAENIDLMVVVEPSVSQQYNKEEISALLNKELAKANEVFSADFDVKFTIRAVEGWDNDDVANMLSAGKSYSYSVGPIMYSLGQTEASYNEAYSDISFLAGRYNSKGDELLKKYHADKLVFITSGLDTVTYDETIGYAFHNMGLVLNFASLFEHKSTLAHELGHTFGLVHPSATVCSSNNYVMCTGKLDGSGFTSDEMKTVNGVLKRDPTYLLDYYHPDFWAGSYSEPMPIKAYLDLHVLDNPIANTINATEVVLNLVDAQGNAAVLDSDVTVELFTQGNTAVFDADYSDIYQRVTFAAGESKKRIDLNVTHGDSAKTFSVGTRYGEYVADSEAQTVTIAAKATSGGGDNSGSDSSGSSGGSFGFAWLALLPLVYYRRQRSM